MLIKKYVIFYLNFCEGRNRELSIKDLLTMSSGLNWTEDYYNPIGQQLSPIMAINLRDLVNNLKCIETPGKSI